MGLLLLKRVLLIIEKLKKPLKTLLSLVWQMGGREWTQNKILVWQMGESLFSKRIDWGSFTSKQLQSYS